MKALVVGANGAIGRALVARCTRAGLEIVATTRRRETLAPGYVGNAAHVVLDLAEDPSSWRLPDVPDTSGVAYLCAAVTSLEACRRDPASTRTINVDRTVRLAERLTRAGARVVFLSSSAVFDGRTPFQRADAERRPVSEYGRQKADAERLILGLGEPATVVRLTKVWAPGAAILSGWARALREGNVVRPFSDMVIAPLPVEFVADALIEIGRRGLAGIVQASGQEDVTYADVARHIARRCGVSSDLVRPVSAGESGIHLDEVPRHTTLDDSRLRAELGMAPPSVWAAVDAALDDVL